MSHSLQKRAFYGTIWSGVGSLSTQVITFVVGVILARLLSPADYGVVAMLGMFTAVASCVIDSGMASALVRKINRTDDDFCTVFYFSLAVSIAMYIILYNCAPYIATFYNQPLLTDLTRVIAITLILGAISGVYSALLYVELNFKITSVINICCAVCCGIFGIVMAYGGHGAWTLVYMQLCGAVLRILLQIYFVKWIPRAVFSMDSFKDMFGFGSKLLFSTIISTIYDNVRPLLIGKLYSGAELGYYAKANQYANLPTMTVHGMFSGVAYPLLCQLQGDIHLLGLKWRLLVRLSCFVLFPIAMGIAAIAEPFVVLLLTEKWRPAVPLIQILSFALILYPVHGLNLDILRVVGRSDAILRAEVYKKILGCGVLVCSVPFGVVAMCWGALVLSVMSFFINSRYTRLYVRVSRRCQCLDVLPIFLLSFVMSVSVWSIVTFLPLSPILQLAVGIPVGVLLYVGLASLFRMPELTEAWQLIRNNLRKS